MVLDLRRLRDASRPADQRAAQAEDNSGVAQPVVTILSGAEFHFYSPCE